MSDPQQATAPPRTYRPEGVEQLADLVKQSALGRASIAITAGRTHERFANLGPTTDMQVDMTALDRVIDYSPVDLTLAVQPGITLAAIDELLAREGQRLALDMPCRESATIGGTFASGLSGPRRLRYGSLKDVVIGAEVVNCEAEVAKSGGMVVKNVSGFEMARLHYGGHGAFGVVSRLNLKVLPGVESRLEAKLAFNDVQLATEAGARILVSTLDPAAVYVDRSETGVWVLHVQIEGSAAFAEAQCRRVIESLGADDDAEIVPVNGNSIPAFDAALDLQQADGIVARLSVPASRQGMVLASFLDIDVDTILADMGSGLIYVRSGDVQPVVELIARLEVSAAYLALPDEAKVGRDVFGGMDASAVTVVRRLKDQFDPHGIFNPGRFIGFL